MLTLSIIVLSESNKSQKCIYKNRPLFCFTSYKVSQTMLLPLKWNYKPISIIQNVANNFKIKCHSPTLKMTISIKGYRLKNRLEGYGWQFKELWIYPNNLLQPIW